MIVLNPQLWTHLMQRHSTAEFATRKRLGVSSCILSYIEVTSVTNHSYLSESNETLSLVPLYYDMCPQCYSTYLQTNTVEGLVICTACGYVLDEQASTHTSYTEHYTGPNHYIQKQPAVIPRQHASYIHKRLHHFRSWIKRIQGLERVYIQRHEFDEIQGALRRYHISNQPTYQEIKFVLKQLRLQKYYNHIFYLMNKIHGEQIISLNYEHIDELEMLFRKVQKPFSSSRGSRVNMLSYSYLLYKLSEHLGWTALSTILPQMISTLKIYRQDQIWKEVCRQTGIPFVRTVL